MSVNMAASSTRNDGDSTTVDNNRKIILNRLAERHAQISAVNSQRKKDAGESMSSSGSSMTESAAAAAVADKHTDFLQQFLQYKEAVINDLENTIDKIHTHNLQISERTQVLDDILLRLDHMQKWLNEVSMYLTTFDNERARLELKGLIDLFHEKKKELLPSKKFGFSRQQKTNKQENMPKTENEMKTTTNDQDTSTKTAANTTTTTTFSTLAADESSMYDPRYTLTHITGSQHCVIPRPDNSSSSSPSSEISTINQSVYLADLLDCTVKVCSVFGSLIGRRLKNCKIYCYPIAGSVWLDDCINCDLVFACRQLRVHKTLHCRLALHTSSRPIIEDSTDLHVAPYQYTYDTLDSDLCTAGLSNDNCESNLWREIEDFSCPNRRLTIGSSNWCILPETEWSSLRPS
uniref:C-CAP/cofactor C-like domain-containing protein n=1 Tax=Trichobilharzia regenti TaxID=157069 RepID=A0AA85K2R2_TRIRE|nr:unnamed protein product [Trichobilharzia regenti]